MLHALCVNGTAKRERGEESAGPRQHHSTSHSLHSDDMHYQAVSTRLGLRSQLLRRRPLLQSTYYRPPNDTCCASSYLGGELFDYRNISRVCSVTHISDLVTAVKRADFADQPCTNYESWPVGDSSPRSRIGSRPAAYVLALIMPRGGCSRLSYALKSSAGAGLELV